MPANSHFPDSLNPNCPSLPEVRDAVFSSPREVINWLVEKGIPRECITEPSPGVLELKHQGKPYMFTENPHSTTVRFEERAGTTRITRWGTGDVDALRMMRGAISDLDITGPVADATRKLLRTPVASIIDTADSIAREQKWKFGSEALPEFREIIGKLSDALRDPAAPEEKGQTAGELLEAFLLSGTCANPRRSIGMPTAPGALGLRESLSCIHDEARTKKLLLGVEEAVRSLEPDRRSIHVVDAGCGTAPLLGLYAALLSEKVSVEAIELNPASAAVAREVVEKFGLLNRIKVVEANACGFSPEQRTDLLISETMDACFCSEPLIDIMRHQARFLAPDARVIPSGVTIRGGIARAQDFCTPAEEVVLGKSIIPRYNPRWGGEFLYCAGDEVSRISLSIPTAGLPAGTYFPIVCSELHIGKNRLAVWESTITYPLCVSDSKTGEAIILNLTDGGPRPAVRVDYPVRSHPKGRVL